MRRKKSGIVICDSIDDFSRAYLLVLGVEVIQGFRGTVEEGLEKYLRGELTPPYLKHFEMAVFRKWIGGSPRL